ncbi:MAG: sensor histidine kinase [Candidatus Pristimantibacillus sp.]
MIRAFLWDRKFYILIYFIGMGIGAVMFLLDKMRYADQIDSGTLYYFIELALFVLVVGLAIDYIRQRTYYRQINEATYRTFELKDSSIVQSGVTSEQKAVQRLLGAQHSAFLTELDKYRRQQELHNHYVLQWVHHMKTPVSVIDLLAQEAQQQGYNQTKEEQKSMLDSMQEETERMTRGLEMMLHTARLDKFELDLHIRTIALHEIIRKVINANKKLCIRYSIFPRVEGEAYVESDEKWLTFVLNQLVSNAIKYSKRKPGSKKLTLRIEIGDGVGAVKLSVEDEGIGIESQDLSRVFDPFFTGENGRAVEESTGMGLYLAKQVCGRLGHDLSLSSTAGEGTTAILSFNVEGIHLFK